MKTKVLLALALLALASPAAAEIKKHPTANVEIDIPAGWTTNVKGENMILTDPTNDVAFILVVSEAKDFKNVVGDLDKKLANFATDIKWANPKPEATKLNGMDALANRGAAKVSGKDANIGLVVVQTPSNKILLVVVMVESSKYPAHKDEIQKLIASIKPSK